MKEVILATEAVVLEEWIRPSVIATLMGLWTWAMLVI